MVFCGMGFGLIFGLADVINGYFTHVYMISLCFYVYFLNSD